MTRVLVAGVGNLFLSDDGFGPEVARVLAAQPLAGDPEVVDVGIRGVHLAYQLLEGYDRLVLVDAAPLGRRPGTVSVVEVDQDRLDRAAETVAGGEAALVDAHGLDPASVLRTLASLGGSVGAVVLVACEPQTVAEGIGLSPAVRDAVPHAVAAVGDLLQSWHTETEEVSS